MADLKLITEKDGTHRVIPEKVDGLYCAHAAACSECRSRDRGIRSDAAFIGRTAPAMQVLLEEARTTKDSAKREGFLIAADGLAWAIAYFARSVQDDTLSA